MFGSPEELLSYLGLTPGSVSMCGLLNDTEKKVKLFVHEGVYNAPVMHLHPNVNTASMELTHDALMKFLATLDCEVRVVS
jgi:Ala-tRNA(Pro) deacylase